MGTDAHVVVVGGPLGLVRHATARLAELEARWSRFLPASDVARLNARSGHTVHVHDDTLLLVRRAADAWLATGGRFDPTVYDALVASGYDRPFDEVAHRAASVGDIVTDGVACGRAAPGCGGIVLDLDLGTVRLPAGVRFDPGGIGKGLAADIVVDELLGLGAAGAMVNVGGDLRASGDAPAGASWAIEVEHPFATAQVAGRLAFASGQDLAVATSSTLGRRWRRGRRVVHHLIDPCTGRSMHGPHVAVTVVATRAWLADVATKCLLDGRAWPVGLGAELPSLCVAADGRVERRGGIDLLVHLERTALDPTEEVLACSPR